MLFILRHLFLSLKKYSILNYQNYIIGIAKKKIQRYYGLLYKQKNYSIDDEEYELELYMEALRYEELISGGKAHLLNDL